MNNIINYYYNLYPSEIIKHGNNYYFFYDNIKYYITLLERPLEDLNDIIEVNKKLLDINECGYIIMKNKNNEYYIDFEGKKYIILKIINVEIKKVNLYDIVIFDNLINSNENSKLLRKDWNKLWSEKIDYFEYQMSVINPCDLIKDSFEYYIGLAENAISYYQNTIIEEKEQVTKYVLSHKRINFPVNNSELYNPLTFIFDYEVRDVAEYIKTMFFNGYINYDEIEKTIKNRYSAFELRMLYARLLYPTYYFDIYESIINNHDSEEKLKSILKKSKEYEDFLFDVYMIIKKEKPIPEVNWIIRKGV